eukprot:GHVP01052710.1.p2 GENE.GHVP01052710.1~~GHVP01052710.1.p2  ORF type:complete len:509 (+),score=94.84 GHVP01052710.1:6411-7937(+)
MGLRRGRRISIYIILLMAISFTILIMLLRRSKKPIKVFQIEDPVLEEKDTPEISVSQLGAELTNNMLKHVWKGYWKHAWGCDNIAPSSKKCKNISKKPGGSRMETTIALLPILKLMGMKDEYEEARLSVIEKMELRYNEDFHASEIGMRIVGSILSAYYLDGEKDNLLLQKAITIAKCLLASFENFISFPSTYFHHPGKSISLSDDEMLIVVLSDCISFMPEFLYLSKVSKDERYSNMMRNILKRLMEMKSDIEHLLPSIIVPEKQIQKCKYFSIGLLSDGYYKSLLKTYIMTRDMDTELEDNIRNIINSILKNLSYYTDGKLFILARNNGELLEVQEDRSMYFPGLIAEFIKTSQAENQGFNEEGTYLLRIAKNLTETFLSIYRNQRTGLAPENTNISTMKAIPTGESYQQRPGVLESLFYLYRLTGNKEYQDAAYEIAKNIETYTHKEGGYIGLGDVDGKQGAMIDSTESCFISETILYLFLIFSENDLLENNILGVHGNMLPITK